MKKLLVMLLALCMVLSMSVALVACGDDGDTDSVADSSVEENSSKADITSEEPVVSDEPSADASVAGSEDSVVSDEPSSEDAASEEPSSEEPSSTVAYEYKTSAAGTNYATNSTYKVWRADLGEDVEEGVYLSYPGSNDWADTEFKKLTDGVVGDPSTYDSASPAQAGVTVQYTGTSKDFVFRFDLGDHYGDVKSLEFLNVRHGTPNGNNRGFGIKLVRYSDDGVNWTRVKGTLTATQVAGAVEIAMKDNKDVTNIEHFNYVYTLEQALKCRYVEITLIPGESDLAAKIGPGYVLQLEEIRIKN